MQPSTPPERAQYLTFTLGREMFAIGILAIKEIIQFHGLTKVPMMPPSVRGVINLRGAVVPVVDLAVRLGRAAGQATRRSCVVIVETADPAQRVMGVLVDSVNAVLEIAAADIEPAPSFGARVPGEFIAGMGRAGGRFVIVLQTGEVLSPGRLATTFNNHTQGT
ncbi:purine-binding chemotaxis protein CheW [Pseudoduganella namucuonensis]|uniref:Purine-binding chemotaxis protein CheW n=2 Tax=Pseudoduganella namucuonensis TaxID=1035707 RepID=A0A1I7H720_9BURK|nr:purine-binding chemotaxis protein CheW [Pseudoduganella namucuonensis]